jgi:GntR family transcriptional regulator/MocR family aminotransferase
LLIPLKLVRDQPLQQQLYDQLRTLIATARLQPGARMPSTRMMAEQFSISRITVLLTYERLIAEGYLQTMPAKGTFVARGANGCRGPVLNDVEPAVRRAAAFGPAPVKLGPLPARPGAAPAKLGPAPARSGLSSENLRAPSAVLRPPPELDAGKASRTQTRGQLVGEHLVGEHAVWERAVGQHAMPDCPGAGAGSRAEHRVGRPDPALFPTARWRALLRAALDRFGSLMPPDHPAGSPALRAAIAGWLSASRGLAVAPDQVILVTGRQQALHIAERLLLRPGERVVLEDPGDHLAECIYADAGAMVVPVPVDCDGLCTDLLPDGKTALVHVTPEHQRPLGVLLSPARRTALLKWAEQAGAMVLEEDCDGEFRYGGMEAPPLMSLDQSDRVIHVGCFSTALGPWLTLGYMVVPRALIFPALAIRRLVDGSSSWLEHGALAEFMESGSYARHVHRLRKTYLARREALTGALRAHFGATDTLWGGGAGLHLAWHVPPALGPATAVAELARHCGLEAAAVAHAPIQAVLLGFGTVSERQIETGVRQLRALHQAGDVLIAE